MEVKTPFRELSRKAKIDYIWDYYKFHILAGICGIAILISLIVHFVTYKESVLDILFVNCQNAATADESCTDDFFAQEGLDPKENEITINTAITISEDASSMDIYSEQTLTLKLSVSGGDVMFAPDSIYNTYAENGYMMPLTEFLSAEELAQYEDILIYGIDPDTEEKVPCGIVLTDHPWLTENGFYNGPVSFGISYNAQDPKVAQDFFRYILETYTES